MHKCCVLKSVGIIMLSLEVNTIKFTQMGVITSCICTCWTLGDIFGAYVLKTIPILCSVSLIFFQTCLQLYHNPILWPGDPAGSDISWWVLSSPDGSYRVRPGFDGYCQAVTGPAGSCLVLPGPDSAGQGRPQQDPARPAGPSQTCQEPTGPGRNRQDPAGTDRTR
jgi:hypothetical protein